MAMDIRHRGTFRTDYEADWARLDDFQALTAEADKLLHRLIRASREIPYHNADGQEVILVSLLGEACADRACRYCPQEAVELW